MTARRTLGLLALASLAVLASCRRPVRELYTIGVLQIAESATQNEVRRGFLKALEDAGLRDGRDIRVELRSGRGETAILQQDALDLVAGGADMLAALSTQSLQAALIASPRIPIVFTSVANPYLTRAGISATEHLPHVTGISSQAPLKQTLAFIRETLPGIRRIGTLWTPSELNSEFYLDLVRRGAAELGFEIEAVPVDNPSGVLIAAQELVNRSVEAIFPISDNTINRVFEAVAKVADENRIPLFGGFLLAARLGACAAMGWDFFDMGYKAGAIAVRVKGGESPSRIPFQSMSDVKLALNIRAGEKQGVRFGEGVLKKASEVVRSDGGGPAPDR